VPWVSLNELFDRTTKEELETHAMVHCDLGPCRRPASQRTQMTFFGHSKKTLDEIK
jgi:hypothetical protein